MDSATSDYSVDPGSSSLSSSSNLPTTTPVPTTRADGSVSLHDLVIPAIFGIVGSLFTLLAAVVVLRSAYTFRSIRRCACNLALIYCATVHTLGSVNILTSSFYVAVHGRSLAQDVWCQINGSIAEATFMTHTGICIFYVAIVLMYKKGNRFARKYVQISLAVNTVLFLVLGVGGAFFKGGYEPKSKRLYCWVPNHNHGRVDGDTYLQRLLLLYLWAIAPFILGCFCIGWLLVKTYHMRQQTTEPWKMTRRRIYYALFQLVFWSAFSFARFFADDCEDGQVSMQIGTSISNFLTTSTGGFQLMIFYYTEAMIERWRVRKHGPSDERVEEIRSNIIYQIEHGALKLTGSPRDGGSDVSEVGSVTGGGGAAGSPVTSVQTSVPVGGANTLGGGSGSEGRGRFSSMSSSQQHHFPPLKFTESQLQEIEDILEELVEIEREDPQVVVQLSVILDEQGPGQRPEVVGGDSGKDSTFFDSHSALLGSSRWGGGTAAGGISTASTFSAMRKRQVASANKRNGHGVGENTNGGTNALTRSTLVSLPGGGGGQSRPNYKAFKPESSNWDSGSSRFLADRYGAISSDPPEEEGNSPAVVGNSTTNSAKPSFNEKR